MMQADGTAVKPDPDKAKEIFLAALDAPSGSVEAFVEAACAGDPELRAEVVSLLARHEAAEPSTDTEPPLTAQSTLLGRRPRSAPAPASTEPVRYRELAHLGEGGCGRVARVYDRLLGRIVALKQNREQEETLRRMLMREARMLAYLDHPGAVQVLDYAATEESAFYTMRVLEGETLRDRIRRAAVSQTPISVGEAVRIISRVCETMANAHAKGLMHLDLKPSNIVLQPFGQVCVIDWGLARFHDSAAYQSFLREGGESEVAGLGGSDTAGGTPGYMPLEQIRKEPLGPAADIYACGAILYQLLTGERPFGVPRSLRELEQQQAGGSPRAIVELRADVPTRLSDLCLRLLAPTPAQRPSSFLDVLGQLQALTDGTTTGEVIELAAGEVLFAEGEPGAVAYQILAGTLSVTVQTPDGPRQLARRTVGELIGEMSIVSDAPRSATMTAVEPTRVAAVTAESIERELDNASPLLARMLRSLSARLRQEATRH
jgi:hypothetical protein